ncbi:MAG: HPP family protein, partial [Aeromonas hydrophila]|nr:HPP family protein [Aeromonas hydrophila]
VLMTGQQWPFLWHTVLPGALLLILLGYGFQRVKWRLGTG